MAMTKAQIEWYKNHGRDKTGDVVTDKFKGSCVYCENGKWFIVKTWKMQYKQELTEEDIATLALDTKVAMKAQENERKAQELIKRAQKLTGRKYIDTF